MYFDHSYFEDDVIEGFYVPSLIKKSWAAQIELLCDIDKVCKKYGIKYFAEWGTLLGTVRHGGFIPWDDDLDICMKRADYMKFLAVAKDELPKEYYFLNYYNTDYYEMLTRLVNTTRLPLSSEMLDKFHGFPFNVGIDIFVLDNLAPSKREQDIHKKQVELIYQIINAYDYLTQEQINEQLELLVDFTDSKKKDDYYTKRDLYLIADRICSQYQGQDSDELAMIPLWVKNGKSFEKTYYEDCFYLPFENVKMPVPIAYNAILKRKYGNYLKINRSGGAHEYPVFQRQVSDLEELLGRQIDPRFQFSMKDYQDVMSNRKQSVYSQILMLIPALENVHGRIIRMLLEGKYESIFSYLEQCQQIAISLGNIVEKFVEISSFTVPCLERYCEFIFDTYSVLSKSKQVNASELDYILSTYCQDLRVAVEKELHNKNVIVFLPYELRRWETLETFWKTSCEDENNEVYVVPIPYYEKNYDGSLGKMHYEGEDFAKLVEIEDYREYDFSKSRPDIIYFQNPYDEYNSAISVPTFFYTKNLLNLTDKLIYVPGFIPDDFSVIEERAMFNLRKYCLIPGVVFADEVLLPSVAMKDRYVELLTETAGADTQAIWEEKIKVSELVCQKSSGINDLVIPVEWEKIIMDTDGKRKKIVVFFIGMDSLACYEKKAIEKIERSFKIFKEYCNHIALIWKIPKNIICELERYKPQIASKLCDCIRTFEIEGWGILDKSESSEFISQLADAFYGDPGLDWKLYRERKISMMVENVDV